MPHQDRGPADALLLHGLRNHVGQLHRLRRIEEQRLEVHLHTHERRSVGDRHRDPELPGLRDRGHGRETGWGAP